MGPRIRGVLIALVGAVCVVMIAACGGGGGDSAATTTARLPTVATGHMPIVAIQDDRLVNLDVDIPSRLAMIGDTGARMARVDVFWRDIAPTRPADEADPADPAYRFERLDTMVRGLDKRGISPLLVVYNAPDWATGTTTVGPGMPYNSVPPTSEAFGRFMRAVASRYSGTFRAGDGLLPRVRHWELWNEPNLSLYLAPVGGTQKWIDTYAGLVEAGYPAVKAGAGDDSVVMVGATGPRGKTGPKAVGVRDWIAGLAAKKVPGDAYSQHIYPAAAPRDVTTAVPSWATLPVIFDAVDTWRSGAPIYITEAGYTTAETPYRKVKVTEEQQAQYLTDIFALGVVRNPRLKAVVWFNLEDNPNWPAGLLRDGGEKKPSYGAFTALTAASSPQGASASPSWC